MIELQSLQPLTAVNFLIHSDQRTFNASAALILKIRHNHSCHARSSILQLCELPAVTVPDCGSRGADELAPTAMPCLAGPACTAWWSSSTSEFRPFSFPLLLVSSRFPPSRLRDPYCKQDVPVHPAQYATTACTLWSESLVNATGSRAVTRV